MATETSIVLELQRLAAESEASVTELLRRALIVATKLNLTEFRQWVNHELKGYGSKDDVPDYRHVRGEIKLQNPYHGLIPVLFHDKEIMDALCEVTLGGSISAIEDVVRRDDQGFLTLPLSHNQVSFLLKQQDGTDLPPVRIVSHAQLESMIQAVRNTILQWALELESQGILGDGMTFSHSEKKRATGNVAIEIHNFQGILGDVQRSQVTQTLAMDIVQGDLSSLEKHLREQGLSEEDVEELKQAIAADTPPSTSKQFGPRVGKWIGKVLAKAASGMWDITINTASALLTKALAQYYGLPS